MRIKTIVSLFMMIFTILHSNPCNSFSEKIDDRLKNTVQELINEHNIPGAIIGIWIPGKGEWVSALGVADKKTKEKMTINDHVRIGSVTKTFTVTALLQLQDQGKLLLDDKIGKYIEHVPNGDEITLRQLANMTSGLPSYTENDAWVQEMFKDKNRVWTSKELLEAAFRLPILAKPGEKFHYCNTNLILLGLVIEKVSGMALGTYLEKNIFKPLKLTNTSFPINNQMPKPFAHGYSIQTLSGHEEDVTFLNPSWAFAAGAMISNLQDLKIWAEALGTGKLLSKKAFEERLQWDTMPPNTKEKKYGLGIGFDKGWLMHTGELPGYNSFVGYLPEKKAILVCLVNSDMAVKKSTFSLRIDPEESNPITMKAKDQLDPVVLIYRAILQELFPKNVTE